MTTISPVIYFHDEVIPIRYSCSSDGRLLFTKEITKGDNATSVWHISTAKKVGPMLKGRLALPQSDGTTYLIVRDGHYIELWPMPGKVIGHAEAIRQKVELDTGLRLSDDGNLTRLDWRNWQELQSKLGHANSY